MRHLWVRFWDWLGRNDTPDAPGTEYDVMPWRP